LDAVTVAQAIAEATARLAAAGVEGAKRDARLLLGHVVGADAARTNARTLADEERRAFDALIARRAAREPVSRILGTRGFWSRDFALSPATLDPRPDTETLIEAALALLASRGAPYRLLDLGTGTGCILLALLSELPNARGLGTDAQGEAVATARKNAVALGLEARAAFLVGDWCRDLPGTFDMILSNPPYIPSGDIAALAPEVARFDPRGALDGGPDGLDCYRRIAGEAGAHLAPDGYLLLEIGAGQAGAVEAILVGAGWEMAGRRKDLAGHDRCIIAKTGKNLR